MKRMIFGAAAVAALLVPAIASAETNALVGLDYTSGDIDGFDADMYSLSGAFNAPLTGNWEIQADGQQTRIETTGCCLNSGYAAVHIANRTDSYAIGAFAGFQDFFLYSGLSYGVEGQLFLGKAQLGASISSASFGDVELDVNTISLDGDYFITPNLLLGAGISQTEIENNFSSGYDIESYEARAEYRFENSPASIQLSYRNSEVYGLDADYISIGLSLDFGTGSLQERGASGPSLGGARNLNDNLGTFGGWIS